jgi:hypothetical protein
MSVLQTRPFETVSIDLVGPFPETPTTGYTYVLTIIDHFTRYPIAVPIRNKDMISVSRALKTHLFMAFPFWPRKIVSDRGKEFVNRVISEIYSQLGIKSVLTSHDNPQANQVERFHRYMNAAISSFIKQKSQFCEWDQYLDCAVYVYRCSTNFTTGHSPFYSLYGQHPIRPMNYMLNMDEKKYDSNFGYTEDILKTFREVYVHIHENQKAQAIANMRLNKKKYIAYKVGDIVNVWNKHSPGKLDWRFRGPFVIEKKNNDNSYTVKLGQYKTGPNKGQDIRKNVSVRHLQLYQPFSDKILDTSTSNEEAVAENSQAWDHDDPDTIEKDTFCIIPFWGWSEIQNEPDTLWSTAKILEVHDKKTTGKDHTTLLVHRYGHDSGNSTEKQRPGWINKHSRKHRYRADPEGQFTIPYTNSFATPNFKYEYEIRAEDIVYHGFHLTREGHVPPEILERIENNIWLDSRVPLSQSQ